MVTARRHPASGHRRPWSPGAARIAPLTQTDAHFSQRVRRASTGADHRRIREKFDSMGKNKPFVAAMPSRPSFDLRA